MFQQRRQRNGVRLHCRFLAVAVSACEAATSLAPCDSCEMPARLRSARFFAHLVAAAPLSSRDSVMSLLASLNSIAARRISAVEAHLGFEAQADVRNSHCCMQQYNAVQQACRDAMETMTHKVVCGMRATAMSRLVKGTAAHHKLPCACRTLARQPIHVISQAQAAASSSKRAMPAWVCASCCSSNATCLRPIALAQLRCENMCPTAGGAQLCLPYVNVCRACLPHISSCAFHLPC